MDINEVVKYFTEYTSDDKGKKYYHNECDFHIIITPDNKVYQINSDHEIWGIELVSMNNLKIRFKSFTGENMEDVTSNEQVQTKMTVDLYDELYGWL